jgi:hypothetical protein
MNTHFSQSIDDEVLEQTELKETMEIHDRMITKTDVSTTIKQRENKKLI